IGCIFTGNQSIFGGGRLHNQNSVTTVTNCTIEGNTATIAGKAFTGVQNKNNTMSIANSNIWNNGNNNIGKSGTLIINYSNIQQASGVYAGTGNINQAPLFVNASNPVGADSIWGTADDGLQLQSGSPAINGGNNVAIVGYDTDVAGK